MELIFGGAYWYYWREFCASKWVVLDNKKQLKMLRLQPTTATLYMQQENQYLQKGFGVILVQKEVFLQVVSSVFQCEAL